MHANPIDDDANKLALIRSKLRRLRRQIYYRRVLKPIHQRLLGHPARARHFNERNIVLDGHPLDPGSVVDFAGHSFDAQTFAHLFSVFDGSECESQLETSVGEDGAPPGAYICVENIAVVQAGHRDRTGLYESSTGTVLSLQIDHLFLAPANQGSALGTVLFGLCAMAAFKVGIDQITLLAAGGSGFKKMFVGYKVWPKFGFDAPLTPRERGIPIFAGCKTVQDLRSVKERWWRDRGSQRPMAFDLTPHSRSFTILLEYLDAKLL